MEKKKICFCEPDRKIWEVSVCHMSNENEIKFVCVCVCVCMCVLQNLVKVCERNCLLTVGHWVSSAFTAVHLMLG